MANDEHVALLKQGVDAWNAWRDENPDIRPDLRDADLRDVDLKLADLTGADVRGANPIGANLLGAKLVADFGGGDIRDADLMLAGALLQETAVGTDLSGADLTGADLTGANLYAAKLIIANLPGAQLIGANLKHAHLIGAKLHEADLSKALLHGTDLSGADLTGANLIGAEFFSANLNRANLSGAHLNEADLTGATLRNADLTGADLTGCRIHGISAWGLKLDEKTKQQNLVITPWDEPKITVDNIEVAQFVYLILNNQKVRDVINTITSKVVLILGRFTDERKKVLDALREELRKRDYVPILFDFDPSATRDITETITLLARMARFIVADLTDPSSIPKELEAIIPDLAVPVQPLLLEASSRPYAMFKDYWKYDWVLPTYRYKGLEALLATLAKKVIAPAEKKVKALEKRRRKIVAELTKSQ